MPKALAAVFSAALLATLGVSHFLLDDGGQSLKDAAAAFTNLKADESMSVDYAFVAPGITYSFAAFVDEYLVRKPPANDLELIFGGAVDLPKTLHAVQKAARARGVVVKHVVCKNYTDAPKVDIDPKKRVTMVEDLGQATEQVVRCRLIRTSVEAAFHRLTKYAEGDYKATAKRIRLERAEARRERAAERRAER